MGFILIFLSVPGSIIELVCSSALGSAQQNTWTCRKLCLSLSKVLWTHISNDTTTVMFKVKVEFESSGW